MRRREFFRWLASATGAVYLEPGLALGHSRHGALAERSDSEVWAWLSAVGSSQLHMLSLDVAPGTDTVVVLASDTSPDEAIAILGFRAAVRLGEVTVEEITLPSGFNATCSPFDLAFFDAVESWCPFDGGYLFHDHHLRMRLRCFEDVTDPVHVGLLIATSPMPTIDCRGFHDDSGGWTWSTTSGEGADVATRGEAITQALEWVDVVVQRAPMPAPEGILR